MIALTRRHLLCAAALAPAAALVACSRTEAGAALAPAEPDSASACDVDGMVLDDYPGPKAQIHYADSARPVFLCGTVEMFVLLLKPEQVRPVRAVFAQDMARADWDKPRGHWFDARTGFYVAGSKRLGSMGPTLASFSAREDAQRFADQWGGRVLAFADVTPGLADLCSGAISPA